MSISVWEHFLGTDWERYAQASSKVTCVVCAVIGVMTVMFTSFLIGLWILVSAALIAVFEFPLVFVAVPNIDYIREFMLENMMFKLDEVKAVAYFALSLFCFMLPSITIFAGLALMMTAILLAFSAVNRRVDAMDQGPDSSMGFNGGGGASSFQSGGAPGGKSGFVNIGSGNPLTSINGINYNQHVYQPVPNNQHQHHHQQQEQQNSSYSNHSSVGAINPHTGLPSSLQASGGHSGAVSSYQNV
jgi:hypothetical protein